MSGYSYFMAKRACAHCYNGERKMKELITRVEELAIQAAGAQLQIDKSEAEARDLGRELGKARQKIMELVNERDHALARVPPEAWLEENKKLADRIERMEASEDIVRKSLNEEITNRDRELREMDAEAKAHREAIQKKDAEIQEWLMQLASARNERDAALREAESLRPRGSRMTSERTFPVLNHKRDNFPLASVPWEFIASHEAQAQRNHAQTLKQLADRGGLSAKEMLAVVTGQHWMQTCWKIDNQQANHRLLQHLEAWKEKRNA